MKTAWILVAVASLMATMRAGATGACTAARFHDFKDMGCNQRYAGAGSAPSGKSDSGNQSTCTGDCSANDSGMPRWSVSEPYINLSLSDKPLSYTMSSGKEMAFRFYYRQRTQLPGSDEVPELPFKNSSDAVPGITNGANCGTNASWGNNWMMSVSIVDAVWDAQWTPTTGTYNWSPPATAPYSQGYQAYVWRPEGGIDYYNVQPGQNTFNSQSQVRIQETSSSGYPLVEARSDARFYVNPNVNVPTSTNGIYWGDSGVGVKLVYPDGSQDVFGLTAYAILDCPCNWGAYPIGFSSTRLWLTQRIDPQGRVTRIGYENAVAGTSSSFRVRYVVDPDNRTNTFNYVTGTLFQLSEIDDPYGRNAQLTYTNLPAGTIAPASITDAAGLTTSFGYWGQQTNGWVTSMTTPYGTNYFDYYSAPDSSVTNGFQQRAIYISEPAGAQQLYLYQHTNTFLAATAVSPANINGQAFDDGTSGVSTNGHQALTYRNTFHWGRRQFAALATNSVFVGAIANSLYWEPVSAFSSQNAFAQALNALTSNDYNKAELKHWLLDSDAISITDAVSSDRDPSPDAGGQTVGLRTWYNYAGKPYREVFGTNQQVSCIARVLADGTSQYTTYNYYPVTGTPGYPAGAGFVSDSETSYSKSDGTTGLLTNWYNYAQNSVDLLSVSNSAGQYAKYGYTNHLVIAITNALNQVASISWDTNGGTWNLTGIKYSSGKTVSLGFGQGTNSRFATNITWSPSGRSFNISSFFAGLPAIVTDDRGVKVTNTWDGLNRLTGVGFPDGTTISNIYYRLDLIGAKDRLGNWTRGSYDGLRHIVSITNANNCVTSNEWCGCGSLSAVHDALTNTTSYFYDNQGNLTFVLFPDNSTITWQYDIAGRMTNAFDGQGYWLHVAYNNQGLPTTLSSANGVLRKTIYDAINRPTSITDANGITVTNSFDLINQLLARTWPDQVSESFGYTTNGLIAYTNRDSKATYYTRDNARRLTSMTNANLEITKFAYDSLNNVTDLWDGNTNHTSWQYNQYGWMTNKLDGLSRKVLTNGYNTNGWITTRWTQEKGIITYVYDKVGNLTTNIYPQLTISYAYDALNRLTNMVDAAGNHTFGYTPTGQLQSEGGEWTSDTVSNTYVQSLRTALTVSQPSGSWSQSYGYDSGWRLHTLSGSAGTFTYNYNFYGASPLVTGINLPNGANIVNSYDTLARLKETDLNDNWGHTLDGYAYTPDALGLTTNIVRNLGLTTSTVTAGYDNIGQLTSWSAQEANQTPRQNEQLSFGYDPAHNLHTRNNTGLSQTFTTDAANQLNSVARSGSFTLDGATPAPATSVTVNGQAAQTYGDFTFASAALTLANGNNTFTTIAQNAYGVNVTNTLTLNLPTSVSLTFDNNGNLTNDGTRSFAYDWENQLTNITLAGQWKSDFVYDGLCRRRIAKDYTWQGGAWVLTNETHFIYDGRLLIQERDANNNPLVTYTRGLDLSSTRTRAGGIGGLLARTDANGSTYYHADGRGNITALINAQENIVARYLYNPYGKLLGQWGPMAAINRFQFSSKEVHFQSGLYYYGFRFYEPNLQRWMNQDPVGEYGGINLYGYVRNNPGGRVDPFGLQAAEGEPFDFDIEPTEPPPRSYAPGTMPVEELDRELEFLRNHPLGETELRSADEPDPRPVVIGRNMRDRVIPFAQKYDCDYYKPGPPGTFEENLAENYQWLKNMIAEGRPIIDIGPDPLNPTPSPYYNMESSLINVNSVPAISFSGF